MQLFTLNTPEELVPKADHWLTEESPAATIALIVNFLGSGR